MVWDVVTNEWLCVFLLVLLIGSGSVFLPPYFPALIMKLLLIGSRPPGVLGKGTRYLPISSLLLCKYFLFFYRKTETGLINPFKCRNFTFSHALYADDCIVSFRANKKSLKHFNDVLNTFYTLTGLSINREKSAIYFSPACLSP